jgi:hypothetical protein
MNSEDSIRLFGMSHQMVERDLDALEKKLAVDLGRGQEPDGHDEDYYPQFDKDIRKDAAEMAKHYELFYCLEVTIRELIAQRLQAEFGADWWMQKVPQPVQENVKKNMLRENESGFTRRSTEPIDFTTFGELGDIARANWSTFADTFANQRAFDKVMASLNMLRGPIAHCCTLAPDEVVRLRLTVKDWFRLMG